LGCSLQDLGCAQFCIGHLQVTMRNSGAVNELDQEEGWPARKLIRKIQEDSKENHKWQDIVMQFAGCAVAKGRSSS
jgi:hypothetical protein